MARFEGVSRYVYGRAEAVVPFPNGEKRCRFCRFCRHTGLDGRYECLLQPGLYLAGPFLDSIVPECPLVFDDENNEGG